METDEDLLRDVIYDSIAEARHTVRVAATKQVAEDAQTFFVSFLLNVDNKTLAILDAVAKKKGRSLEKLLRRYCIECLKDCVLDQEEAAETELKRTTADQDGGIVKEKAMLMN